MDRRDFVRRGACFLHLGASHFGEQLEWYDHIERKTRIDRARTVPPRASSNLYRITDDVGGDCDRGGPRRRNYRCAARVRELLDETALRRTAHVGEIPERVFGLSKARKTAYTFRSLTCPSTAWRPAAP